MDTRTELAIEGLNLQLETMAAALLALNAKIDHIANESGIVIDAVKLKPEDEEQRNTLMKSIAQRLVKVAVLSAKAEGIEVDQKTVANNTIEMLQEAVRTKGENVRDPDATAMAMFKGTEVADAKVAEENSDYAIDEEPAPMSKVAGTVSGRVSHTEPNMESKPRVAVDPMVPDFNTEGTADGYAEDEGNMEPTTDEDLLAVFRTTRKKKVEDPYTEFDNGAIRANFYNPETLPEDPEEFMQYEAQAVEYFKNITEKARKAELLDKRTANQVVVVLHGGVNFQEDQVMTPDRKLMQLITEQGHEQPYFEATPSNPVEAAEILITAYSVSIARLRGAYMQAKLQELQDYVQENG